MSALTVRLPDDKNNRLRALAQSRGNCSLIGIRAT